MALHSSFAQWLCAVALQWLYSGYSVEQRCRALQSVAQRCTMAAQAQRLQDRLVELKAGDDSALSAPPRGVIVTFDSIVSVDSVCFGGVLCLKKMMMLSGMLKQIHGAI